MEIIQSKIFVIRGVKVMLDKELASLYGVATKALNQAVKRNTDRFPDDFMFQLTEQEWESLRSQIVTLKETGKHSKYLPYVFTQNGIAMLSSVLGSASAIQVNITIMRWFVKTAGVAQSSTEIYNKILILEKQGSKNEKDIGMIFTAIKELYGFQEKESSKRIGF